jgi:hypothetical protein
MRKLTKQSGNLVGRRGIDMTGQTFNHLVVIALHKSKARDGALCWTCECKCGTLKIVSGHALRSGTTKSCGCLIRENGKGNTSRRIDLVGRTFGRLLVKQLVSAIGGKLRWLCMCTCGTAHEATSSALTSGNVQSCGCWLRECRVTNKTTHGQSAHGGTHTFHIFNGMHARCGNPNSQAYKDYGGRGITVCKRWAKFETFFADMGECPAGLTIERKNNNKGYSPANCTWATPEAQANNRRPRSVQNRNALRFTYKGETLTLKDWGARLNLSAITLYMRLHEGWTLKQALTTPKATPWTIKRPKKL